MESLRGLARRLLAAALYYSGLLWLLARSRLRQRAVVLMYHRVLPANADTYSSPSIVVTPEEFARQMAFLKRHFKLLSMDDLAAAFARREPLPSMSCVVTFDDGWFDNHRYALPILRQTRVPAVVFAATDYIGGEDCFWQERLARRLCAALRAGGQARDCAEKYAGAGLGSLAPAEQKLRVLDAIGAFKKHTPGERRAIEETVVASLRAAGVDADSLGDDRFMSWEQLAELAKDSRVVVGSHGCSHTPLTMLAPARAREELTSARQRLEAAMDAPVRTIGYPNGNYDDGVVDIARAAGYELGFTTDKGTIAVEDDPLRLNRINISGPATRSNAELLCTMLLVFMRFRRPPRAPLTAHANPGH